MTSTRSKVGKPTMLVDKVLRNNVLWDPDLERITRILKIALGLGGTENFFNRATWF